MNLPMLDESVLRLCKRISACSHNTLTSLNLQGAELSDKAMNSLLRPLLEYKVLSEMKLEIKLDSANATSIEEAPDRYKLSGMY